MFVLMGDRCLRGDDEPPGSVVTVEAESFRRSPCFQLLHDFFELSLGEVTIVVSASTSTLTFEFPKAFMGFLHRDDDSDDEQPEKYVFQRCPDACAALLISDLIISPITSYDFSCKILAPSRTRAISVISSLRALVIA